MNRQQMLDIIGQSGDVLEIECVSVGYRFDFSLSPHRADDKTVYELGRNDVDIPVVVDIATRHVYFLDARGLSFINSSFQQMIDSFNSVNEWNVPDDAPDAERARLFSDRMRQIDCNCFRDPEACWSVMREEIEHGVI